MARATWLAGLLALALSACAETGPIHSNGNGGTANPPDSLERVLSRTFTVPAFKLESGQVLPELTLAYETYGRLAPGGRNAILVTHGFTSGAVAVVSAPKGSGGDAAVKSLLDRFATDPNWNGGWHYERGGIFPTLLKLRIETLERYGQNEVLARTIADPDQRAARLRQL